MADNENKEIPEPNSADVKDLDFTEKPMIDFIKNNGGLLQENHASTMNEATTSLMRQQIRLSFLMKEEFALEREQFFNEMFKRGGIDKAGDYTADDVASFIGGTGTSRLSEEVIEETAPNTILAANAHIDSLDVRAAYLEAGYLDHEITNGLIANSRLSYAYATAVGGGEGHSKFVETIKESKNMILSGLSNPKVSLALSGAMLGIAVVSGVGPLGLAIKGVKVAHGLLGTETGQKFKDGLEKSAINFLEKAGVDPKVTKKYLDSFKSVFEKISNSRLSKVAMLLVAGVGIGSLASLAVDASADINISEKSKELFDDAKQSFNKATEEAGALASDFTNTVAAHAVQATGAAENAATNISGAVTQAADFTVDKGKAVLEAVGLREPDLVETTFETPYEKSVREMAESRAAGEQPKALEAETKAPALEAVSKAVVIDIEKGDTLWNIAKDHYSASNNGEVPTATQIANMVNSIAEYNGITDPNTIYAGKTIIIHAELNMDSKEITGSVDWMKNTQLVSNTSMAVSGANEAVINKDIVNAVTDGIKGLKSVDMNIPEGQSLEGVLAQEYAAKTGKVIEPEQLEKLVSSVAKYNGIEDVNAFSGDVEVPKDALKKNPNFDKLDGKIEKVTTLREQVDSLSDDQKNYIAENKKTVLKEVKASGGEFNGSVDDLEKSKVEKELLKNEKQIEHAERRIERNPSGIPNHHENSKLDSLLAKNEELKDKLNGFQEPQEAQVQAQAVAQDTSKPVETNEPANTKVKMDTTPGSEISKSIGELPQELVDGKHTANIPSRVSQTQFANFNTNIHATQFYQEHLGRNPSQDELLQIQKKVIDYNHEHNKGFMDRSKSTSIIIPNQIIVETALNNENANVPQIKTDAPQSISTEHKEYAKKSEAEFNEYKEDAKQGVADLAAAASDNGISKEAEVEKKSMLETFNKLINESAENRSEHQRSVNESWVAQRGDLTENSQPKAKSTSIKM